MRKRGPYLRLSATLALLGLLMSSTVVAWAAACQDDCRSVKQAHSCCESDDLPMHQTRMSAPSCCDSELAMTCGSSATFESPSSSAAHGHSDSLAGAAARTTSVALAPRPEPVATAPPLLRAPIPPLTRTVVLLL
jgi:hypothetical protein